MTLIFLQLKKTRASTGAWLGIPSGLRPPSGHRGVYGTRTASDPPRGPGPLKVEAADPAIAIENLTNQIETRHQLGFHRPEIDLFEMEHPPL